MKAAGIKLLFAISLWLPMMISGAGIYDFVADGAAVVIEADLDSLRGTELEKEIKEFNRKISDHFGGQYDFSAISEQLQRGVFTWNGDTVSPDFTILVQGDMGETAFNRILADSVEEKLIPVSLNGHSALRFPQESLNKKIRGKMDLVSSFVTDDIVMISDRGRVEAALNASVKGDCRKDIGKAFLKFSGRPADTVIGMFFRGVKNAVIEAAVDDSGRGIDLSGVAVCQDVNMASAMAMNTKMLIQAFIPLVLERDIMLQSEILKALEVINVDNKVELSCKLNGATVEKLFRYAEKEIVRENRQLR